MSDFVPPTRFEGKDFDSYIPRHPSQESASARLSMLGDALAAPFPESALRRFFKRKLRRRESRRAGHGVYLDGGFGVGKTHLLAAYWRRSAEPKFYLAFDELMYFVGLMGTRAAADAFRGARLIAIDEWELDDPGNLKLALAFLRSAIRDGACVAVTSNTVPLELGSGRFSQKDFTAEIEDLASVFEVVRVEGEDYRRRHFAVDRLMAGGGQDAIAPGPGTLRIDFAELMSALNRVHPSRYREFTRPIEELALDEIGSLRSLADALRWVHFIDAIYVGRVRLRTEGRVRLDAIFPGESVEGPFGKKLLRCISRLHELLKDESQSGTEMEG